MVGETFTLIVYGDSPIMVSVGCFVDTPPPPRFKTCAECSIHRIQSGEQIDFTPDQATWQGERGGYQIKIRDARGDTRELKVNVVLTRDTPPAAEVQVG